MAKQYAVFGLGDFGYSVALTLERLGCEVIVVDKSEEKIQDIADSVSYAMRADLREPEVMKAIGARNLDGAVVALSDAFEAAVMVTILSKEAGVPYVVAKAGDELHGKILEKVGADAVVYPEREAGARIAKNLVTRSFADWIELSPDYSMIEHKVPQEWAGKSLAELKLREKYQINMVGIIRDEKVDIAMDPNEPLPADAILILIGSNEAFHKFIEG